MYEPINKMLEGVRDDIIKQYNALGLKASGYFARNIKIARQSRYKTVITLPYYAEYITKFKSNKGGSKGRTPNGVIEKWIRDKAFPLRDYLTGQFMAKTDTNISKVAYLIRRKIFQRGTDIKIGKRKPIDLDKIINDRLDYAGEELADRVLQEIKI